MIEEGYDEENETYRGFDLCKFREPEKAMALIKFLDLEDPQWTEAEKLIRTMEKRPINIIEEGCGENMFTTWILMSIDADKEEEYCVMTDEEADKDWDESLDRDQWVEAVRANNTDEGYSDWVETVKRNQNRGEALNYHDGSEEEEKINDTTYYIYRR